jgi:predicted kinase
MDKPTLLVIRGAQGAGKSTIAFSLVQSGLFDDYVEADMYFQKDGEYKYVKEDMSKAHTWCFENVKKQLEYGRSVIVSNTSCNQWEYQKYLDLAKEKCYNIQVMVLFSEFENVHNVPEDVVKRKRTELLADLTKNGVLTGE